MWNTVSTLLLIVAQYVVVVVIPLLFILQKIVQTQDKRPGNGLVKEEYQAAMQWLFVPLIKKDVQERAEANAETFSGKSMHDVILEWRLKLKSCFELLKKGAWQSELLNQTRKPKMKAKQDYDAAQAHADQAKVTRDALVSESDSKVEQANLSNRHWRAQMQSEMQSAKAHQLACLALQATKDAVDATHAATDADLQHKQAQDAADAACARYNDLQREYEKALKAFEPSWIPFFLMQDNCPSYSPFADKKQKEVLPICPMLQVGATSQPHACYQCRCGPTLSYCVVLQLQAIPPRAHDINQGVEHANGCAKGHTAATLSKMKRSLRDISDAEVQGIVLDGAKQYTASSWLGNTKRLVQCLRLLCTPDDTEIKVLKTVQRGGVHVQEEVNRKGTNGNYCYSDFS